MKASTLIISALAIGLSLPAIAQQSMHRYVAFFKYSDTAVKAMTETPQEAAHEIKFWFGKHPIFKYDRFGVDE